MQKSRHLSITGILYESSLLPPSPLERAGVRLKINHQSQLVIHVFTAGMFCGIIQIDPVFTIVLVVKKPELIKEFWLWLVGFAGIIIRIGQMVWGFLVRSFSKIFDSGVGKKAS